jgi:glycosyltransferase involved in cell wall biosynthesis
VRLLNEIGWRVVFSALRVSRKGFVQHAGSTEARRRYEESILMLGVERIVYGPAETEQLLRVEGQDIRWAYLYFPEVAHELIPYVRLYAPGASIIYDMVDFHYLRLIREVELRSNIPSIAISNLKDKANLMRLKEITSARSSDVTIAVSEEEAQKLRKFVDDAVIDILPNIFELPDETNKHPISARKGCLFVGGFAHAPNVDAVLWFVDEVLPLILDRMPHFSFSVVGSDAPPEVLALKNHPCVEVLGFVPNLSELLSSKRMSVAPLRFGAGIKGKIGQSLAHGLPVVTTTIGAEGMRLVDGEHVLIADNPEAFAAAAIRLANDDQLWKRLRARGRKFIETTQSLDVARGKLEALLNG